MIKISRYIVEEHAIGQLYFIVVHRIKKPKQQNEAMYIYYRTK